MLSASAPGCASLTAALERLGNGGAGSPGRCRAEVDLLAEVVVRRAPGVGSGLPVAPSSGQADHPGKAATQSAGCQSRRMPRQPLSQPRRGADLRPRGQEPTPPAPHFGRSRSHRRSAPVGARVWRERHALESADRRLRPTSHSGRAERLPVDGEEAVRGELVARHGACRLSGVPRALVGPSDADDAWSEAVAVGHEGPTRTFRPTRTPKAWLVRIAHHRSDRTCCAPVARQSGPVGQPPRAWQWSK